MNDERIDKALQAANRAATIHLQKQNLRHRLEDLLVIAYGTGMFRVTRDLICFVDMIVKDRSPSHSDVSPCGEGNTGPGIDYSIVLIDDYKNPILIDDLREFKRKLMERYRSATNEYHLSYSNLTKARTPSQAVELGA